MKPAAVLIGRVQEGRVRRVSGEIEREEDAGWLTEVPDLPGVVAYGRSEAEARAKVQALALRGWSPIA